MTAELIASGRYVNLVREGTWEFVERTMHSGVAVIVAVTDDDELVLVEQHRVPVGGRVIELPAGLAGDHAGVEDESVTTAAHRELLEETGFTAKKIDVLTVGPPGPGLVREVITLCRAHGLERVGKGGGDDMEDIDVHLVPLDDVVGWLQARANEGLYVDPKTYAGLFFVLLERGARFNAA